MARKSKFDTPEKREYLEQAIDYVEQGVYSIRDAGEWLSYHINDTISYEGFRKHILKRKGENKNGVDALGD